ncbi:MAG: ion transporter, partial [Candidatus Puniceispirillaceae bacterium]
GIVASAFSNQISRRKELFQAEIVAALSHGVITEDEMQKIEEMQKRLGMSDEHAAAVIELLRDKHVPK